jgi:metallo-beta-lactamase family protein
MQALTLLQPVGYERAMPVADGIEVDFINAGHLLGSAYARVRSGGQTILFGGDLGRFGRPVLPDPTLVTHADYLLVESTYGNRVHADDDDGEKLAQAIRRTAERGGRVIIPAFAVGRVEELLWWIRKLEEEKRIPVLSVFVDSPMATAALARYTERVQELDEDLHPEEQDDKAPHGPAAHESRHRRREQARRERELSAFVTQKFRAISGPQESKDLTRSKMPAIIISSSGMATGGRVLHHLKAGLPDSRNTVLLVGFQAEGTRGRRLVDGEKTVRIHGIDVPVNAQVEVIDSMSAHADSQEILRWLRGFETPPKTTYLVHGEPAGMQALQQTIVKDLRWNVHAPKWQERVEL